MLKLTSYFTTLGGVHKNASTAVFFCSTRLVNAIKVGSMLHNDNASSHSKNLFRHRLHIGNSSSSATSISVDILVWILLFLRSFELWTKYGIRRKFLVVYHQLQQWEGTVGEPAHVVGGKYDQLSILKKIFSVMILTFGNKSKALEVIYCCCVLHQLLYISALAKCTPSSLIFLILNKHYAYV